MATLTFHGAAETVTGSKYLLELGGHSVLIDCGVFQGPRDLRVRNWEPPAFDPRSLDAVILTHAHIDHIGFLPRLVRQGLGKTVFATPPTADLAEISLLDSAEIQEEDAAWRNKKRLTRHEKALPLFTTDDARAAIKLFKPAPFGQWHPLSKQLRFRFHPAGHILGAAGVEIEYSENDRKSSILFSGDIGRYGNPLTVDPAEPPEFDYLVCESTYGARLHPPEDPRAMLIELINDVVKRKSVLLVPAFAVGRAQQVVYLINELTSYGLVPPIDIHIDSPMAVVATDVYIKYKGQQGVDLSKLGGKECLLSSRNVHLHRKRESSKMLNKLKGPAVIISSSGMLTGGRIMHHLMQRLPDPTATVALVGFMAAGTRGRQLAEGAAEISIHNHPDKVHAGVVHFHGLSGHADFYEILHWLEPVKTPPRMVFVTHG
ncbi:MAG: MBL fold metallo-hydrolase, partial [Candidatus Zixiibacteriota bacterium]